jgi:hypothetical protein
LIVQKLRRLYQIKLSHSDHVIKMVYEVLDYSKELVSFGLDTNRTILAYEKRERLSEIVRHILVIDGGSG